MIQPVKFTYINKLKPNDVFLEIINAIKHHLKGCLKDSFPDIIILHHETNNPKNDNNLEIIARDIVNLGLSWYIFQV